MAEEFAEFIKELNKEPVEKQLEKVKDVVSKLVFILKGFIKKYDIELNKLHNKLITLETKQMASNLPKMEILLTIAPAPAPQLRLLGSETVHQDIMGELKSLFEKKAKLNQSNEHTNYMTK